MKAKEFESDISIRNLDEGNGGVINAKSILKVLAAGIRAGATVTISAEGRDEERAVDKLVELIETGFSEKSIGE
jgi:phosphotransferase system HPr (HPr) family protein